MEAKEEELAETFVVLIDHDADFEAGFIGSETVRNGCWAALTLCKRMLDVACE